MVTSMAPTEVPRFELAPALPSGFGLETLSLGFHPSRREAAHELPVAEWATCPPTPRLSSITGFELKHYWNTDVYTNKITLKFQDLAEL